MNQLIWSTGGKILTGETEVFGESPLQCHFVEHKSHTDWSGIETEPPQLVADYPPPVSQHSLAQSKKPCLIHLKNKRKILLFHLISFDLSDNI
jgi:hypothetical protein